MKRSNVNNFGIKSTLNVEYFAGDVMKVIGEMCHQLSDFDMLQNQEILDVVSFDLYESPLAAYDSKKRRPKPTLKFLKNYHSGNDLVLSKVRREKNAESKFNVIRQMCDQLSMYDNLSAGRILALIKSYLDIHIVEVDV